MRYAVKLHCRACGSVSCKKHPTGSWCDEDEGCEKYVTELESDMYYHYMTEIKPLIRDLEEKGRRVNDLVKEVNDFIEMIEERE